MKYALQGVFIPIFGKILVKISVLGVLYPYRATDWGEIWRGLCGAKNLKIGL